MAWYNLQQLAELFKWYGNIKSCDLVLDETTGKSKGFGFVEMIDQEAGEAAIAQLERAPQRQHCRDRNACGERRQQLRRYSVGAA